MYREHGGTFVRADGMITSHSPECCCSLCDPEPEPITYEYFRRGVGQVWHIAPAFSALPLPERNQGRALSAFA